MQRVNNGKDLLLFFLIWNLSKMTEIDLTEIWTRIADSTFRDKNRYVNIANPQ